MANSMDEIKVTFGISLTKEEQDLVRWRQFDDEKKKKAAELKSKMKTVTIPEFLAVDPKELSEVEQKIQRAIRLVYDLNGKDPPLYRKFPTYRSKEHPLTIDITTAGNNGGNYSAAFGEHDNRVIFEEVDDTDLLILTLAHELKHAEQSDEEAHKWYERAISGISMENAYAWHQLEFMHEAQAYMTGARAYYEIMGATENPKFWEVKTYANIVKKYGKSLSPTQLEEEAIRAELNDDLLTGKRFAYYKDAYDSRAPIGEQDKGLDHIPEVFHLSPELLSELQKVPRVARTTNGKLLQAQKNGHVDEYMRLLQEGIEKGEDMSHAWFTYVCENGTLKQIQEVWNAKKGDQYLFSVDSINFALGAVARQNREVSREITQFLLGVKRDGKSVIDTKTVIRELKDNRTLEDLSCYIQNIQDNEGLLPITAGDCATDYDSNSLFRVGRLEVTDDNFENALEMLPTVLKLKGIDGKVLVTEKQFVTALCDWVHSLKQPDHVKALFQKIADENGSLPFSREMFDIRDSEYEHMNGQNRLLYGLSSYNMEDTKSSLAKLPILMALKDKDGKPIISKENVEHFLEYDKLAPDVQAAYEAAHKSMSKTLQEKGFKGKDSEERKASSARKTANHVAHRIADESR